MTATRHGFFRAGFMLCDRCALNVRCDRFVPGGECVFEKEIFERVVREFTEVYGLDLVADRALVELAALNAIRLMRVWNYESAVGFGSESQALGVYTGRLEKSLLRLLRELDVSRSRRGKTGGGKGLLVDVRQVIQRSALAAEKRRTRKIRPGTYIYRVRPLTVYRMVLKDFDELIESIEEEKGGENSGEDC